ncbi:MAG: hypothetical protein FWG52_07210 [Proteobacteria bacterium]|jgi:hypothetical protein|nr:hypothetical protein [Pseudomonadota bacterium]
MRTSFPHKYWIRLFIGVMTLAFSLGHGFSMSASAASALPQAGEDSGTETPAPETPQPPKPKPPRQASEYC